MIKSIAPSSGWYYVAKGVQNEEIVFHVASWALTENNEVVGMIAAANATTKDDMARLVMPPPIKGTYLHEDQLSEKQREVVRRL